MDGTGGAGATKNHAGTNGTGVGATKNHAGIDGTGGAGATKNGAGAFGRDVSWVRRPAWPHGADDRPCARPA
jgi:hypothetical protein